MAIAAPIFLYTDFGAADIYVGQVKAVLHEAAPACAVIDLLHDAPPFEIAASAHLLAALAARLPPQAVTIAVVDPGVGGTRDAVAVEADGRWYLGPDNGLLSVLSARARASRVYALQRLPGPASASFHGRDLFAPAAARIAVSEEVSFLVPKPQLDVELDADEYARVIYIDHYGNALTGVRASSAGLARQLEVAGRSIDRARVFSDVAQGALLWYENSIGLVEIAANKASAASLLGLQVGAPVAFTR